MNKIKQAAEGTQVVGVTWNELDQLNDATGEAFFSSPSADKRRLTAVQDKVVKFFEEENAGIFGIESLG